MTATHDAVHEAPQESGGSPSLIAAALRRDLTFLSPSALAINARYEAARAVATRDRVNGNDGVNRGGAVSAETLATYSHLRVR